MSVIFNAVTEYLSEEGKIKVCMMFASDGGQPCLEITKTVIRVRQNYMISSLSSPAGGEASARLKASTSAEALSV